MYSAITLSDSFDFVLFADGVGVGTSSLGGVDDFISKAFLDALQGSEGGFLGTLVDEVDSLIDSAEGGNVDSLSADGTT